MRLIGVLENEKEANRFLFFLKKKKIESHCDASFDVKTGLVSYHIWVYDEDQWKNAEEAFSSFLKNPSDCMYDPPEPEVVVVSPDGTIAEENRIEKPIKAPLTTFLIFLCMTIFFYNTWQQYTLIGEGVSPKAVFMTPIQSALLFDFPYPLEKLESVIQKYQLHMDLPEQKLPQEVLDELQAVDALPIWKGGYNWLLLKLQGQDPQKAEGPVFYKILQGEVWRLFSPALLHLEFLHVAFNMIWVWVLGRAVEQRVGFLRFLLFTLFVGIISNTAQYLMSGPFFIGYSGVVMGLAGFIWMRQRIAPWEGYPVSRGTLMFLVLFVLGMCAIQITSFFLQAFTSLGFAPNIANTAHIVGGLAGIVLGRMSLFAERVLR